MQEPRYTQAQMDQAIRAANAFNNRDDGEADRGDSSAWSWLLPMLAIGGIAYGGYKLWPSLQGGIQGVVKNYVDDQANKLRPGLENAARQGAEDETKRQLEPIVKDPVGYLGQQVKMNANRVWNWSKNMHLKGWKTVKGWFK